MTIDTTMSQSHNNDLLSRNTFSSYEAYIQEQRRYLEAPKVEEDLGSPRLWCQMTLGFLLAATLGVVFVALGWAFISGALATKNSILIMLCLLGIVCGIIIVIGTAILGKVWISRKWRIAHGQTPARQPPQQCFQTCSVVHTRSQDAIDGSDLPQDPPPEYNAIVMADLTGSYPAQQQVLSPLDHADTSFSQSAGHFVPSGMARPPRYSEVNDSPPKYGDCV